MRTAYFDRLRVVSVFFIVMIHAAAYCWYDADLASADWLVLNAYKALARWAVPVFVMISGALFLDREIPLKKLYGKYVLRLVLAFIIWSLIYAVVSNARWGMASVLIVALTSHYHLWFLPMVIGLYICLPVLRLFTKTEKTTRYFLLISFLITIVIPQLLNLLKDFGGELCAKYVDLINLKIMGDFDLSLCLGYIFFFVFGFYINKTELEKGRRTLIYILGLLGLALTIILTTLNGRLSGAPSDTYHGYLTVNVALMALAVFVFFKYNVRLSGKSDGVWAFLGKCTFGVYLIHPLVMELADTYLGFTALSLNPVLGVPAVAAVTFAISLAVSAGLNKLPGTHRFLE